MTNQEFEAKYAPWKLVHSKRLTKHLFTLDREKQHVRTSHVFETLKDDLQKHIMTRMEEVITWPSPPKERWVLHD